MDEKSCLVFEASEVAALLVLHGRGSRGRPVGGGRGRGGGGRAGAAAPGGAVVEEVGGVATADGARPVCLEGRKLEK